MDTARWSFFSECMANLDKPPGTLVKMTRSINIAANLNRGVQRLLADERLRWLLIMGDDHAFANDYLQKLLDRNVQAVVSVVSNRQPPFNILAWQSEGVPVSKADLPATGLHPIYASGSAGLLVRREVFELLPQPWFENSNGILADEDTNFCRKLAAHEIALHLDTEVRLGHIGSFIATPRVQDGTWGTEINFGDGVALFMQ